MTGFAAVVRPEEARTQWVWKFPRGTTPLGAEVAVEMTESVVIVRDGRVLGALPPGRHRLDPSAIPFLMMAPPESDGSLRVEFFFVSASGLLPIQEKRTAMDQRSQTMVDLVIGAEVGLLTRDAGHVVGQIVSGGDPAGFQAYIAKRIGESVFAVLETQHGQTSKSFDEVGASFAGTFPAGALDSVAGELGNIFSLAQRGPLQIGVEGGEAASVGIPPTQASVSEEDVYEMLWDCKYCGQKKNLGLTHRFCPSCGGPQDAGARYFPEDSEKIAVRNHPFVGADVSCPACKHWNSKNAKCCTSCGSPLDGGASAQLRPDQMEGQAARAQAQGAHAVPGASAGMGMPAGEAPKKKGLSGLVIALIVVGLLGVFGVTCTCLFAKRDGSFEVADRTWQRTIQIERYDLVRDSRWCDERPVGGIERSRSKAQRSTNKVPDGQTCVKKKKDRGNGTFKEEQVCTPKYKETPVYADKCEYDVPAWKNFRTVKAEGGPTSTPDWPKVDITRPGTCMGCEREGSREESYSVKFTDTKTKESASCTTTLDKWKTFDKGSKWDGKIGIVTNAVDCDSLKKK